MARRPANKRSWTQEQWGDFVQERSDQLHEDQQDYRTMADAWLDVWKLKWSTKDPVTEEASGKLMVTPNDPYNIVKLTERLLGGRMRIDVVAPDDTKGQRSDAEKRELWLGGFWNRQQMETGINVRRQAIWWAAVRGRFALDVRWVKEVLPDYYRDKRLPVMVRALDPLNVLQQDSEFGWPAYTIHRYETPAYRIRERWGAPAYKALPEEEYDEDTMVPVNDYWDAEWNAVVVNGKTMKPPRKHEYPRIPIILAYADSTPLPDPQWRGMSILHPMADLWKMKAKVWSYIATGLMWYFWPAVFLQNEMGGQVHESIEITPGETYSLFPGEKATTLNINPNVPLAEVMQTAVTGAIQDATYPRTLYGAEPGVELAGYALANLSSSARGRVGPLQEPMEWAFAQACQLVLDLVHDRGRGNVEVWQANAEGERMSLFNLKEADLSKHMPIKVSIALDLPKDEQQRAMRGLEEIKSGVLSRQTYREKFMSEVDNAELEGLRVLREIVENEPEIQKAMAMDAFRALYGRKPEEMYPPQLNVPQGGPPGAGPGPGPNGMPPMPELPPGPPPPGQGGPMLPPGPGVPSSVLPPQAMMPVPEAGLPGPLNPGTPLPPPPPPLGV